MRKHAWSPPRACADAFLPARANVVPRGTLDALLATTRLVRSTQLAGTLARRSTLRLAGLGPVAVPRALSPPPAAA
eukprot:15465503-Alexandrium_andersonii.AAC.1